VPPYLVNVAPVVMVGQQVIARGEADYYFVGATGECRWANRNFPERMSVIVLISRDIGTEVRCNLMGTLEGGA